MSRASVPPCCPCVLDTDDSRNVRGTRPSVRGAPDLTRVWWGCLAWRFPGPVKLPVWSMGLDRWHQRQQPQLRFRWLWFVLRLAAKVSGRFQHHHALCPTPSPPGLPRSFSICLKPASSCFGSPQSCKCNVSSTSCILPTQQCWGKPGQAGNVRVPGVGNRRFSCGGLWATSVRV